MLKKCFLILILGMMFGCAGQSKKCQSIYQKFKVGHWIPICERGIASQIIEDNEWVSVSCSACCPRDEEILRATLEKQTKAWQCLSEFLGHHPKIKINYKVSHTLNWLYYRVDTRSLGGSSAVTLTFPGFIGIKQDGQTAVNALSDVRMDIHETAHAFTNNAGYFVHVGCWSDSPTAWLHEGISIYLQGNRICPQIEDLDSRYITALRYWEELRVNERSLDQVPQYFTAHTKGALFFASLEREYGCDENCFRDLWNLYMRASKDHYLTNHEIKKVTEKYMNRNLDFIFYLLEIDFRQ